MSSLKLPLTTSPRRTPFRGRGTALLAACLTAACAAFAQGNATPQFASTQVMSGLSDPWDIAFAPGGPMFFTEKCAGLSVRMPEGTVHRLIGNAEG
ncbi:MAG TPA: PQQ-dependent sugar dehydrogenase, partial [Lautropia sp.]|nr:PQQ-dependent sugar dehydrogenase [Lautropia sp.]